MYAYGRELMTSVEYIFDILSHSGIFCIRNKSIIGKIYNYGFTTKSTVRLQSLLKMY